MLIICIASFGFDFVFSSVTMSRVAREEIVCVLCEAVMKSESTV